jgi:hypothetical protein
VRKSELPRPRSVVADVLLAVEAGEEFGQQRVVDFGQLRVRHQVLAGSVCDGWRSVNQNVMPWLVSVRLSLILLVPRFVRSAGFVNSDDDSAITVAAMLDQPSDFETLAVLGIVESDHSTSRTV